MAISYELSRKLLVRWVAAYKERESCIDKINAISTAAAHFLMVPLTRPELMFHAEGGGEEGISSKHKLRSS